MDEKVFAIRKKLIKLLQEDGDLKNHYDILPHAKMQHGTCCCCPDCGHFHDDCVCTHNRIIKIINNAFGIDENQNSK